MEKKVLIVDDESGIRKVLKLYLQDMGYQVFTSENGETALSVIAEQNPSIVLTDIKMPVMDGIALLKHIKREWKHIEVIMLTGHGDMELAIKCLKLEAADFITKPINDEALEIALKRAGEKIVMREEIIRHTENLERRVKEQSKKLVELERSNAVGQAVEGLRSAIRNIAEDLKSEVTFFNEMPCFVSVHSPDLVIVAVNQQYRERLGDLVGKKSGSIYEETDESERLFPITETFRTGIGQRRQKNIIGSSGEIIPVIVYTAPIRNRDNEVELVIEIAGDVAEVERLQEQLRTSRERYLQLFNEAPCYITVLNENYEIISANRRFKEDFDFKSGANCFRTYKKLTKPCPSCPVQKTFHDGRRHQYETEVIAKDGTIYNMLVWTAPIRNISGKIMEVMEMSTNITQLRKLQSRLSTLGMIIGTVSHGIKGLLTGLDAGMYLLGTGIRKKKYDQMEEGLEIVEMLTGRIRSLVLDILHYAKERELKWEKVNTLKFVNEVLQAILPKIKDPSIQLRTHFGKRLGFFEIQPGVMKSTLMNLLENALEACMNDRGKSTHHIDFKVSRENDNIRFDVIDDGPGMEEEIREKIFTLFYSSKGDKGMGLGLFLSHKLIHQYGGDISVQSKKGAGSHFKILLPKILPMSIKQSAEKTIDKEETY